jgi:hypothetical protein
MKLEPPAVTVDVAMNQCLSACGAAVGHWLIGNKIIRDNGALARRTQYRATSPGHSMKQA